MEKVSLYIPAYNASKYITKSIEGVLKQVYPIQEIIIIDDGSMDQTAQLISGMPIKLIRHNCNKGIAAARNSAVSAAKGDFIASIDADCLIEPAWLKECMKNFTNPNIAAVGGKLTEANGERIEYQWKAMHLRHHWGDKRKANPIFLSGSNVVIRKKVFEQVGFYNENKFKKNYEDVDLSLRLKRNGFDLIYEPAATARHMKTDTLFSALKSYWSWQFYDYKPKYILRAVFNVANALKLIYEDIKGRKPELILMDILTIPFSMYFDFKRLLEGKT